MPVLRAHQPYALRRRNGRYLPAARRRKRRNLLKFIPEGDSDFALTASNFAWAVARRPEAYELQEADVEEIRKAVSEFRTALATSLNRTSRTQSVIFAKDRARQRAEEVVRRYANIIRANPRVGETDKQALRLKPRPTRLKRRTCPQDPPVLTFLGSGDGVAQEAGIGNGSGVHVLRVEACEMPRNMLRGMPQFRSAKPDGATRLELFVDLVPQGHPIPRHPAELTGRPWYLGSFTTSRIEVKFPIPSEPMLVVYWGRWADARGGVGRFSVTCPARLEGWVQVAARPALPAGEGARDASRRIETKIVYVQVERSAPAELPDQSAALEGMIVEPRRRMVAAEVRSLPEAA